MKSKAVIKTLLAVVLLLSTSVSLAQEMKVYTWDSYKMEFSVPSNFWVTKSTGECWEGTNNDIAMTLYPRRDENLSMSAMKTSLHKWVRDCNLTNIGELMELDYEKLNGYWGVGYEGELDGFPVAVMLIIDPDYPGISMYIWVAYRKEFEETVIKMLMSFTPS